MLPDALLHRYKFWRSQEAWGLFRVPGGALWAVLCLRIGSVKANGELLVGEERDVADQPTELRVKIQPVKTLKRESLGLLWPSFQV